MSASPWVVTDELWSRIEPLLPVTQRRQRYPGRKRKISDRQAFCGILFVLRTGIAWEHLPKPSRVLADRAYDHDKYRLQLEERGVGHLIARRNTDNGSGLGRQRWVVERTFAWLHQFRRLLVRFDRSALMHEAFLSLASCLICFRRLQNSIC